MKKKILFILPGLLFIGINAYADKCASGNCKNGSGSYSWNNGAIYEGHFKKGKFHGTGKFIDKRGNKNT